MTRCRERLDGVTILEIFQIYKIKLWCFFDSVHFLLYLRKSMLFGDGFRSLSCISLYVRGGHTKFRSEKGRVEGLKSRGTNKPPSN